MLFSLTSILLRAPPQSAVTWRHSLRFAWQMDHPHWNYNQLQICQAHTPPLSLQTKATASRAAIGQQMPHGQCVSCACVKSIRCNASMALRAVYISFSTGQLNSYCQWGLRNGKGECNRRWRIINWRRSKNVWENGAALPSFQAIVDYDRSCS